MKRILLILVFLPLLCFPQKPNTPVIGFSTFNLGDSISKINSYGYQFKELNIEKDFDYSAGTQVLDSFQNFCDKAKVFYTEKITVGEFEFNDGAILTYYNNKLIDIRILDYPSDQIKDAFILKYGASYGKIFLIGYQYSLAKLKAKKIKVTASMDRILQDEYLSSIFWNDAGNTLSVGGSNVTYNFLEKHFESANTAKPGISVTNTKEYGKLVSCSNSDYAVKLAQYLKNLKMKTKGF